jgi:hypothetical protein
MVKKHFPARFVTLAELIAGSGPCQEMGCQIEHLCPDCKAIPLKPDPTYVEFDFSRTGEESKKQEQPQELRAAAHLCLQPVAEFK